MTSFKEEINNLLNEDNDFIKQYCYDRDDMKKKWGDDYEYYKDTSIQYIIITEDIPEGGHIEYFSNYSGSEKINEILDKYNLWYDWENEAIASVYKVEDFYDTDEED